MPFVDPFAPKPGAASTTSKAVTTKFVDPFGSNAPTASVPAAGPKQSLAKTALSLVEKYGGDLLDAGRVIADPLGGILSNQKVQNAVGNLAKGAAQSSTRSTAGVAADVLLNKQGFTPTGRVEKAVFGPTYVPSYTERVDSAVKTGQKVAVATNVKGTGDVKVAGALGGALAAGLTTADIFPVFPEKTELQQLAKLTDVEQIKPILSKLGIATEDLDRTATIVSKFKNPKDIGLVIDGVKSAPGAIGPEAARYVPNYAPLPPEGVTRIPNSISGPEVSAFEHQVVSATDAVPKEAPVVTPVESVVRPTLKPVELAPEQAVTSAAKNINETLVAKGFDALPPEELAKYTPITKEQTIARITDFIQNDPEGAKAAVSDISKLPNDIHRQPFFNAMKEFAKNEGDPQLLRELAASPIAEERSTLAQQLGSAGYNTIPDDPVEAIRDVMKARETTAARRYGDLAKAKTQEVANLADSVKKAAPTPKDWVSFVKSIQC